MAGYSQKLKDIKLIGGIANIAAKPIAFINGIRVSSRFAAGMQLEDAALSHQIASKFETWRTTDVI